MNNVDYLCYNVIIEEKPAPQKVIFLIDASCFGEKFFFIPSKSNNNLLL